MSSVDLVSVPPIIWRLGEGSQPPGPSDRAVGHDEGTLFIREGDGSIVSRDFEGRHPLRFVNSSERAFVESVQALAAAWSTRRELDDDAAELQTLELRRTLSEIDSAALDTPDAWWGCVLEQFEQDLI